MNSNTQLRQKNLKSILRIVREKGPISKRDMQKELGVSWGTISTLTNEFYEGKYIIVSDVVVSNKASRTETVLWDINPDRNFVIGVDFHFNKAVAVVTDLKGRIVCKETITFADKEWDRMLEDLFALLDPIVEKYQEKQIIAISFSAQGVVDTANGVLVLFKKWAQIPLKDIVEARYQIPTFATHDTDCLMRCEQEKGIEQIRNAENALLLRLEQGGVGMAIMIHRKPYIGASGRSGEFGRILVSDRARNECVFAEKHVCGEGIVNDYCILTGTKIGSVTFDEITEKAHQGDAAARRVFSDFSGYLAEALTNTVNIFDPEVIALYGHLCTVSDLFLEETQRILEQYSYGNTHDEKIQLHLSNLGEDAAANGAALIAIDKRMEKIIQHFNA